MSKSTRKPRLDEDQRKILEFLSAAADDGKGEEVHVRELQRGTGVLWIRSPLESLKRCGLVDHDDGLPLTERFWQITDAGREALR